MNIAIVEDEKVSQKQLLAAVKAYLAEHKVQAEISCYNDGTDFLQSMRENKYQVVFLDIYMKETNGIETAECIRSTDSTCMIIFCTASAAHMPEAFSFHAFDYLMKPVEKERLWKVMDDVLKHTAPTETQKYLSIENQGSTVPVFYENIVTIETQQHYLNIRTDQGVTYSIRKTLPALLEELDGDSRFLLVNRGILANMQQITGMENGECTLRDGSVLPIRIRGRAEIVQKWHDFSLEMALQKK